MPAFSEIPLQVDDMPPTNRLFARLGASEKQQSYLDRAYRMFILNVVRKAEVAPALASMEMDLEGETGHEFTLDEIETYRVGAMAATIATVELLQELGAINDKEFGGHIVDILQGELAKGWRP